ncbi:MAG: SGNH/GDSL hydrolase family protein [Planctomycetes bacterium]|nr:SGNH/GDSL hydrolase family protein [Planctomycetota bacterium]
MPLPDPDTPPSNDECKPPMAAAAGLKRREWLALAAVYLLCGLHFSDVATTLVIGLMTLLGYQCIYRRNRKAILLVVSVVASFVAFSYAGKFVIRRAIALTNQTDVDHRLKPNKAAGINSDGLRCPVEASDFTADTRNIIFLGDSYTYGFKLSPGERPFPDLVEDLIGGMNPAKRVRCVNFGWTSSSPLLSGRLLKDFGAKYKPSLVVLTLDMTDFHDDLRYAYGDREDVFEVSPGEFVLDRVGLGDAYVQLRRRWMASEYWSRLLGREVMAPYDKYFIVNQPLEQSRPFLSEIETNLNDIGGYCKETLKVPFVVVMVPRHYQYTDVECPQDNETRFYRRGGPYVLEAFRWLEDFRTRAAFPCYSLLDDFKSSTEHPHCFADDPHWNQLGHTIAARGMMRVLRKEGFVK